MLSHGMSDDYIIFFLRNRGSEKERLAEEMPISEVRKCSRLLTPFHSLIYHFHHCVVGTCQSCNIWLVLSLNVTMSRNPKTIIIMV